MNNNFGKLGVLFRCWWNRFFPSWNERYMYQSSSIPTGRMQRPSTYLQMLLGHWAMEHTLMGHGSAVITISAVPTTENYSQAQHELWHYSWRTWVWTSSWGLSRRTYQQGHSINNCSPLVSNLHTFSHSFSAQWSRQFSNKVDDVTTCTVPLMCVFGVVCKCKHDVIQCMYFPGLHQLSS